MTDQKQRIFVSITGDLFHFGHVEFLRRARAFGDWLVVGLCDDETVASYKRPPILSLAERSAVVSACKYVDEILEAAPADVPKVLIEENLIDIVVASTSYSKETIRTYYKYPDDTGILRLIDYTPGISTTEIIMRAHTLVERLDGELPGFS